MNSLKEYNKLYGIHNAFTLKMANLIESLIKENGIKYHLIEKRTKTQLSFAEKIIRKNKDFDNDKEITDISGIRIIAYYQKDVDKISHVIKEQFDIDNENSIDKSQILENNEFGYQSIHYVIKLNSERAKWSEWASFKDLKAEVQVRTVLQHSWASISHELQYKKAYEIPDQLKRKLFRLAGLFELADEQFGELKEKHHQIEKKVFSEKEDEYEELKNEINSITIDKFIRSSDIVKTIEKIAVESGFTTSEIDSEDYPKRLYIKQLSDIQKVLKEVNIKSIDELNTALEKSIRKAKKYFTKILNETFESGITDWDGSKDFFLYLLLLTEKKDLSNLELDWSKDDANTIRNAVEQYYS